MKFLKFWFYLNDNCNYNFYKPWLWVSIFQKRQSKRENSEFWRRHYDADYNRNNRKIKNQHIIAVEKQLRLNNRTLDKYYKANITNQKKGFVQCYLTILKADNFTTQHHAGIVEKGAKTFYCLYDYKHCLFKNTINQLIIEIHKE